MLGLLFCGCLQEWMCWLTCGLIWLRLAADLVAYGLVAACLVWVLTVWALLCGLVGLLLCARGLGPCCGGFLGLWSVVFCLFGNFAFGDFGVGCLCFGIFRWGGCCG